MKALVPTIAVCAAMAFVACGEDDSTTDTMSTSAATAGQSGSPAGEGSRPNRDTSVKPTVTAPKGVSPEQLAFRSLVRGKGAKAKAGDEVTVQYVGVGYESGEEFDTSWGRKPLTFQLGGGQVIPGWDQGLVGMRAGGRRELVIPPELAYGAAGAPPAIGPNEALVFVVDLLEIE